LFLFQQEEFSRYDPERDLPYDPLQPSIRAPDERIINENITDNSSTEQIINEKNSSTEYIPSRQHQVSGTSFRHDPNIESSTIENLDDDDEDVYDPNKPTLFQQIQPQTTNTTEQIQSKPNNITPNTTAPKRVQGDEGKIGDIVYLTGQFKPTAAAPPWTSLTLISVIARDSP
jgi:hypothetical protein